MPDSRTWGRLKFLAIAAVFLGPLIASFALYYGELWRPSGSTEHGTLILPPRVVPESVTADGAELPLRGRWSLVIMTEGECDPLCRDTLYETRQLRLALGRERDRVQRVWLAPAEAGTSGLVAEHPDLRVASLASPSGRALAESVGASEPGEVLVVDPLGNLMLRFPPDTGMRDIHTDLKRLLRASMIG